MFNGAKRMTCIEVREILSDLIDVRNGEIPPEGASRLSQPEVRADAESHLAGCGDCRAELVVLEEIGGVFADFNVGELPAQHFAEYGSVVRKRIADEKIVPISATRKTSRFGWWKMAASASVAACCAFAVIRLYPKKPAKHPALAVIPKAKENTPIPLSMLSTPMSIYNDAHPAGIKRDWTFNPSQPKKMLDELRSNEGLYGYLILEEPPEKSPLLGVQLRTMRDVDQDLSKNHSMGLRVHDIVPDSVASEMGLMCNDMIVCINGMNVDTGSVDDAVRFLTVIHNLGDGAIITLHIVREDKSGVLYMQRRGVLGQPKAELE